MQMFYLRVLWFLSSGGSYLPISTVLAWCSSFQLYPYTKERSWKKGRRVLSLRSFAGLQAGTKISASRKFAASWELVLRPCPATTSIFDFFVKFGDLPQNYTTKFCGMICGIICGTTTK